MGLRRLPLPPGADKGGDRELGWHEHRGPAAILPPALGTWVPISPWSACISVGLCLETLMVHRAGHGLRKSQTQNGKIRTQEQCSRGQEDKAETSTGTGAKALWLPSDQSKKGRVTGCRASLPEAAANTNRWACTGSAGLRTARRDKQRFQDLPCIARGPSLSQPPSTSVTPFYTWGN